MRESQTGSGSQSNHMTVEAHEPRALCLLRDGFVWFRLLP
jgi:hypothetical protein